MVSGERFVQLTEVTSSRAGPRIRNWSRRVVRRQRPFRLAGWSSPLGESSMIRKMGVFEVYQDKLAYQRTSRRR